MAKRGANARKQFISVKGLYDIVIRAKIKRRDFFRGFISRGQDNDSTVHRLDQGNELNTVTVGQAKVEQNKFTTRLTRTNKGVGGGPRLFDPKPSAFNGAPDQAPDRRLSLTDVADPAAGILERSAA